jgi:photosystem II stability/assembly factor-like uncharacterized protein
VFFFFVDTAWVNAARKVKQKKVKQNVSRIEGVVSDISFGNDCGSLVVQTGKQTLDLFFRFGDFIGADYIPYISSGDRVMIEYAPEAGGDIAGTIAKLNVINSSDKSPVDIHARNIKRTFGIVHNSFVEDTNGDFYLLLKDCLYYMSNLRGDDWVKFVEGIDTITIDPQNPQIFYAVNIDGQIIKSMDRGKEWVSIHNGFPNDFICGELVVNPHNNQEVFALAKDGLYKTDDSGFAWEKKSSDELFQLLIHPKDKTIFYALKGFDLIVSHDAGATWSCIDNRLPGSNNRKPVMVYSIGFLDPDGSELFAVTEGNNILKSGDHGKSWTKVDYTFNTDGDIFSVVRNKLGVCIYNSERLYSLDYTLKQWASFSFKNSYGSESQIINAQGVQRLVKYGNGFLVQDISGKIICVDNSGRQIGLNYGLMPHTRISNITYSSRQKRLYAFVENLKNNDDRIKDLGTYGLYYSVDLGETWNECCQIKSAGKRPRLYFHPTNENEMWMITSNILKSSDSGKTWIVFDKLNSQDCPYFGSFSFDPIDSDIRYLSCDGLYRYDRRKDNTMRLNIETDNGSFKVADDDPNKMLVGLKLSTDKGWTWTDILPNAIRALGDDGRYRYAHVNILKFKSNDIFINLFGGDYLGRRSALMSSSDLGITWSILREAKFEADEMPNRGFDLVYVNPDDPDNVFISYREKNRDNVIIQSTDRGLTWKPFCIYKTHYDIEISMEIIMNPNGRDIFIGTYDGLYRTKDEGMTWELIGGLKAKEIPDDDLAITPSTDSISP